MITEATIIGDLVVNGYGEAGVVRAETDGGKWWVVENVISGRVHLAHKVTADSVIITAEMD